ncbi:histone acetyltransferase 1 [Polyrhizophydium stewartii]|uniref:Histone acetyltransferase type B catalytic subunit n=1 Tax=Polyrhizophydium stewartii TaxID=2732419 RepID=A0ABR4N0Y4_9FUNG
MAFFASHNPLSEWVSSSNDSLSLRLVSAADVDDGVQGQNGSADAGAGDHDDDDDEDNGPPAQGAVFHPLYTYPVFGDEEKVFGYKDLDIKLYYAAGSLFTYLGFTYSARIGEGASKRIAPGVQPQDVVRMMSEKIPPGMTHNYDEFVKRVQSDETTFRPMGTKIHEYQAHGKAYEMYECTFTTPRFKEYHRRLQTFLVWFIEGASFLQESDTNWHFVLVFEKSGVPNHEVYKIVGYLSYYPFYHFPDKRRMRISQFIILPPFQKQGHGRALYSTMMDRFIADPNVVDVTVEDPNDFFQDMRDRCDVQRLLDAQALKGLAAPLARSHIEDVQRRFKLCKRQANRCIEIVLLHRLKRLDARANKQYRLFVKARIFRQNREVLESIEFDERLDKLQSTYLGLIEDYRNVLESLQ